MNDYPLTLLYDGACPLCVLEMERLMTRNERGQLRFVDAAEFNFDPKQYGVRREALMRVIHGVKPDGSIVQGIEAIRLAYAGVGLNAVAWLLGVPMIDKLATWAYPYVADNRYVISRQFRWLIDALKRPQSCTDGNCNAYVHSHYDGKTNRSNADG
jgi:predicted DCC family thiol-disulfide oxidoreductase YuxK